MDGESTEKFCGEGNSPSGLPENAPQEEITLPLLPDEVWEKIFKQVTSLDDMRNVVNLSWEWRRFLDSRKVLFLFPNVVPLLTKYMTRNEVLKCRLVCKSWEQGVDEYFESALNLAPYTAAREKDLERREIWQQKFSWEFPYIYCRGWPNHEFGEQHRCREELRHSRNPHIGRALIIKTETNRDYRGYVSAEITEYLSRFGYRIRFLDEYWTNKSSKHVTNTIIEGIFFTLTNMPNLVQYRMSANIYKDGYKEGMSWFSSSDLEKLKGRNVLPKLRTLQLDFNYSFKWGENYFLDDVFISMFSNQLGRLENIRWTNQWSLLDWTNLTDLRLDLNFCGSGIKTLQQLNAPKLKKLFLSFGCDGESFNLQMFYTTLKSFPTLESVGIIFKFGRGHFKEFAGIIEDMQFPNITDLTINNRPISRNLLHQFPSLRSLQLVQFLEFPQWKTQKPTQVHGPDKTYEDDRFDPSPWWKVVLAEADPQILELYDRAKVSDTLWLFSISTLKQITVGNRKVLRDDMIKSRDITKYFQSLLSHDPSLSEIVKHWLWKDVGYGFSAATSFFRPDTRLLYFHRLETTCGGFEEADICMKNVALFQEVFPTVQEMVVNSSPVLKKFLRCFPNLKHLKIPASKSTSSRLVGDCHIEIRPLRMFCRTWHDPILYDSYDKRKNVLWGARVGAQKRICESEVWSLLPSLEKITLVDFDGAFNLNVFKEVYVCTRRDAEQVN